MFRLFTNKKTLIFEKNLYAINKIEFTIGGLFAGYETSIVTFDRCNVYMEIRPPRYYDVEEYNDYYTLPKRKLKLPICKRKFLDRLAKIHVEKWERYYNNRFVLDGTQWDLTIYFSNDHEPIETGGSNSYPYNFDILTRLLGK